ncbi:MAG: hypothetical protein KAR38_13660, partial [Calditrichia bacterium]|nr:hypothetical protein [Calditrichia bacterium]
MQSGSPCLGAGQYGYNYGSVYSIDRPGIPEFFEVTDAAIEGQIQVRWVNPSTTVNGNPITSLSSVKIWRNETLVEESNLTSIGDTLIFYDTVERPDYFRYRLCAVDDSDNNGRITFSPFAIRGGEFGGIVIWDLDLSPVSGAEIESALGEIAYSNHIYLTNTPNKYPL